jgi:hypothetical protein
MDDGINAGTTRLSGGGGNDIEAYRVLLLNLYSREVPGADSTTPTPRPISRRVPDERLIADIAGAAAHPDRPRSNGKVATIGDWSQIVRAGSDLKQRACGLLRLSGLP